MLQLNLDRGGLTTGARPNSPHASARTSLLRRSPQGRRELLLSKKVCNRVGRRSGAVPRAGEKSPPCPSPLGGRVDAPGHDAVERPNMETGFSALFFASFLFRKKEREAPAGANPGTLEHTKPIHREPAVQPPTAHRQRPQRAANCPRWARSQPHPARALLEGYLGKAAQLAAVQLV